MILTADNNFVPLGSELFGGLIAIRIGINTGIPVAEGRDFFGMAVRVAARLCELAAAGEILASADVVSDAGQSTFTFTEVGPRQLKGRASTVADFRLEDV